MHKEESTAEAQEFRVVEQRLQFRPALDRLSKADPANVLEIVASQIELMTFYHNAVIEQARKSFRSALIASGVGFVFFLFSIGLILFRQPQQAAVVSLISGALIEFISVVNFYLYAKSSRQFADFQARLDTTQRFLLANSICEGLPDDARLQARLELIRVIVRPNSSTSDERSHELS